MVDRALTDGETASAGVPAADESRALIPLAASAPRSRRAVSRPAAFLAHLIAVKDKHPQTRERRRVAPAEAISAYRTAMAVAPANAGKTGLTVR